MTWYGFYSLSSKLIQLGTLALGERRRVIQLLVNCTFFFHVSTGQRPGRRIRVEAGTWRRVQAVEPPADLLLAHRLRLPDLLRVPHRHHRGYG